MMFPIPQYVSGDVFPLCISAHSCVEQQHSICVLKFLLHYLEFIHSAQRPLVVRKRYLYASSENFTVSDSYYPNWTEGPNECARIQLFNVCVCVCVFVHRSTDTSEKFMETYIGLVSRQDLAHACSCPSKRRLHLCKQTKEFAVL